MNTFRDQCHFDDCDTQFVGVTREEYVNHLYEEHSELEARIYDEMVSNECPSCGDELETAQWCQCGWRLDEYQPYEC